jgi:hypothetical protein
MLTKLYTQKRFVVHPMLTKLDTQKPLVVHPMLTKLYTQKPLVEITLDEQQEVSVYKV